MTSSRVRMSPAERRAQLVEIGVSLLSTRPLEDLSIELLAEEASISRGLLYHYFGSKQEFHRAVVRRAAEDLYALTAPGESDEPLTRLAASLEVYIDYVVDNHAGYVSLVRAARGGDKELREIYESARNAMTDRVFEAVGSEELAELGVVDSPAHRMIARAWAALAEELVLEWVADRDAMTREELVRVLAGALPSLGSFVTR